MKSEVIIQCNYCIQGHLDKVDQSDYRKITIHSKKVGCWPISGLIKNNKLLEARNLILIANVFQESKMFHQTIFFPSKTLHTTPKRRTSLTQAVILSPVYHQFLCYYCFPLQEHATASQDYNYCLCFSPLSLTLTGLSANTCFLQWFQKVTSVGLFWGNYDWQLPLSECSIIFL